MNQHRHQYYAYVICQMTNIIHLFFHIVKDIVINARYGYISASTVICFICVLYDILYQ